MIMTPQLVPFQYHVSVLPVHCITDHVIYLIAMADDLKTNENDDDSREKAWQWAGIGASVGMCMGFVTGISFMFAWQRWIKLFRGHITKDAALSRGAHGSGDPRNKKKSSANYTSITNEPLINSEHRAALNSTAVNESFELTGINRTSSFHSLSCYTNDV